MPSIHLSDRVRHWYLNFARGIESMRLSIRNVSFFKFCFEVLQEFRQSCLRKQTSDYYIVSWFILYENYIFDINKKMTGKKLRPLAYACLLKRNSN